jgi:hypothetical protein
MREHCRTQHGYDPEPIPRPPPQGQRKTTDLINSTASAPVEKFLKMMTYTRFQQTEISDSAGKPVVNSMGSLENALNYLLDNFVIVRKKEFQGISGYFCKKCLSFQYRYIKDIWDEKTAKDRHEHIPNIPYDANRLAKELEGRSQANRLLIELTNSLFTSHKKFEHYESSANFHGPVIKFDSLSPNDWAWNAIMRGLAVTDAEVNEFIINVQGSYAQINVENGHLSGSYMVAVQTIG